MRSSSVALALLGCLLVTPAWAGDGCKAELAAASQMIPYLEQSRRAIEHDRARQVADVKALQAEVVRLKAELAKAGKAEPKAPAPDTTLPGAP